MYDLSADLKCFYETEVRLGKAERDKLAGYRDSNMDRLRGGLKDLGAKHGVRYRGPQEVRNQGSYAMHSLNRHRDNDYDIDVAIVFEKDDLPADAQAARERVRDALLERSHGFIKDPEARKNAVTVWYAEGYHIDFAVYRRSTNWLGLKHFEHAGADGWVERDPEQVTTWFKEAVDDKSPWSLLATVEGQQLRRIVRLLKWFAKSRTGWNLPGGMILSALVVETYRADGSRDDVALNKTITALRDRLRDDTTVWNPVNPTLELTAKEECRTQVENLLDRLETAVEKLSVLDQPDCTNAKARAAWKWFFRHDFWGADASKAEAPDLPALRYSVTINCGLARSQGARVYANYASGATVLPKGIHLRFTVANTNVPSPYSIRWMVRNEGDEARAAEQVEWQHDDSGPECWTSTAYRGNHTMMCQIHRAGVVLAEAAHVVQIRGEPRRGWLGRRR